MNQLKQSTKPWMREALSWPCNSRQQGSNASQHKTSSEGRRSNTVEQSSALGSLLVEREDMQHACGIKVRPNSGKNPGVLRAKTLKTSRQSSLTSRSGRSNSRTSAKSSSRASHKSTKSKAAGRAESAKSSRKGSRNVPQKTTSHNRKCKGKGRG